MLLARLHKTLAQRQQSEGVEFQCTEEALRDFVQQARSAASLASFLSDEGFVDYVAQRIASTRAPHLPAYGAHLYVAYAATQGDIAAQRAVHDMVVAEVDQSFRRSDRLRGLRDDVIQILTARVLIDHNGKGPKLLEYTGRGPIGAWLRASALGTALNLKRQERPGEIHLDAAVDSDDDLRIADDDPELIVLRARSKLAFRTAFSKALGGLSFADRTLIRLRYVDGLTLEALAAFQQVHRATVVRKLAELSQRLLDETKNALHDDLELSSGEIDSFVRAARSHVDFSLRSMLRNPEIALEAQANP